MTRFVIAECRGGLTDSTGNLSSWRGGGLEVSVLDRAYCHRVVRSWRTEDRGGPTVFRQAYVRAEAAALAARLNAEHDASVAA